MKEKSACVRYVLMENLDKGEAVFVMGREEWR